jgi:BON domain
MKTDMQLKQDIISELNRDPSIHSATIGVEVKDGIVTSTYWNQDTVKIMVERGWLTLSGFVEGDYQRRAVAWGCQTSPRSHWCHQSRYSCSLEVSSPWRFEKHNSRSARRSSPLVEATA